MRFLSLPPPDEHTPPAMAEAIYDCQGDWWDYGSSICRKPNDCLRARACYFVVQVRRARKKQILAELAELDKEQHSADAG